MNPKYDYKVGVIADTHGLVRPGIFNVFKGVDLIIHAGDIESPESLQTLQTIAKVTAVRGNVDKGGWAYKLPKSDVAKIGKTFLYILHDISQMDLIPEEASFQAVISGHSHKPALKELNGVIYLNPGSAGPRRFKLPISLAVLYIKSGSIKTELVELKD